MVVLGIGRIGNAPITASELLTERLGAAMVMAKYVFGYFNTDQTACASDLFDNSDYLRGHHIFRDGSPEADALASQFQNRLEAGERLFLIGFTGTWHNSGISLVEASRADGIVTLLNCEEERFAAKKHFSGFPIGSCHQLVEYLATNGIKPSDVFAVFYTFDVVSEEQTARRMFLANSMVLEGGYYRYLSKAAVPEIELDPDAEEQVQASSFHHSPTLVTVFRRLIAELQLPQSTPCVMMRHHENHAYFSYGVSPFYTPEANDIGTMIACLDGSGDLSSVSLFSAQSGTVNLLKRNQRLDSLGVFYMLCASILGGWSPLSAEGRYMGAAAWGNGDRLTNPYYRAVRNFFFFGPDGQVCFNVAMAAENFRRLEEVVGPFVPISEIWNPDSVINVDDIKHSKTTQRRVDIAAAVQMTYEDALFHIIGDLIITTGSNQLVLCGGTALNCVANMRLLEKYDDQFFRRYLSKKACLELWVPPVPSDQGAVVGAPFQFAMKNGAQPAGRLHTPFLCGLPPTDRSIEHAIGRSELFECKVFGSVQNEETRRRLADWMAYLISREAVVGIFQKQAETGPRALGHRSILSNPCNPNTLELLNVRVKRRERIRPLAPMVTLEEALELFELSDGASAANYNAYDYMVLTARARPRARALVPAIVHYDGTSRIQIVRAENNVLIHDYLLALKRHIGVSVSVNTSLNVASPIVQTPEQALGVFERSNGLDCLFFVSRENTAYMVWPKPYVQELESRVLPFWQDYQNARQSRNPIK